MTNLIKSSAVIILLLCSIACSTQNSGEKNPIKSIQSTVINGIVMTIENGKDGYTADVQTSKEGVFAALVSIVNIGSPENYQRFNIGDNVILKGIPWMLEEEKQLKVEKIIKVVPPRIKLFITPTSFRGITIGDKIANHSAYIQKEQLRTGEGVFEIYRIKDFNNNPAGYFLTDPNDESLVGDITVETQMAQTAKGIKIGSTFKQLSKALPNMEVHGSEIEGRTYASSNNISYRLDMPNFSYEVDISKIPSDTKITQIVINRGYESAALLNNKYSKISSDEYCWLVNKKLDLFAKPSSNSTKQGIHFKGEVLKVLDSRIIDKQLWVNVEFTLQVKTGYEDRFADGRVTPSGLPTGWIGGTKTPLINCK